MFGTKTDELRGRNYPASTASDDPTDASDTGVIGSEGMCGAQWIVRYLMGKKLDGYVPARLVPPSLVGTTPGAEQELWYEGPGAQGWPAEVTEALPRSGPFLEPGVVKLKAPKAIPGSIVPLTDITRRYNNPVIVDAFEMPILYYAANSVYAGKVDAQITAFDYSDPNSPSSTLGVYTYRDNALFTGFCSTVLAITVNPWDFGGGEPKMHYGPEPWTTGTIPKTEVAANTGSCAYYIMNKDAYESSSPDINKKAVVPNRRDQYILMSPGKDGRFGTNDDVTNFQ
jgi:hypothetical protein